MLDAFYLGLRIGLHILYNFKPPFMQPINPITKQTDILLLVAGHQEDFPFLLFFANDLTNFLYVLVVQIIKRIFHDRLRDSKAPPHAQRIICDVVRTHILFAKTSISSSLCSKSL